MMKSLQEMKIVNQTRKEVLNRVKLIKIVGVNQMIKILMKFQILKDK